MTPNPFKDIQVFYDGFGNTAVSWILDDRFDDPYPHKFELQFSKSPTGFNSKEYETIDAGTDVAFLKDKVFRTAGYAGAAYYRVVITTPAGTYLSGAKGNSGNVDRKNLGILSELLRKENLAFRSDRGATAGYLFKRRYYGPKCECTDSNTDTVVALSCPACAGTGFKYGYFPGVEFPILISSAEVAQTQISDVGAVNLRALEARCLAFPIAEAKDIWLEKDSSRIYEIKKCSIVSRYSYAPIAAQIELRELTMADTVSLVIASMRDLAVPQNINADKTYYTPIIIAENSAIKFTADSLTPTVSSAGTAGLVSAANSPFAELLANSTLISDKDKIKESLVSGTVSLTTTPVKPSTSTTTTTVIITSTDIAPTTENKDVCSDDLDGGLY
jgi:hypothetical protein